MPPAAPQLGESKMLDPLLASKNPSSEAPIRLFMIGPMGIVLFFTLLKTDKKYSNKNGKKYDEDNT